MEPVEYTASGDNAYTPGPGGAGAQPPRSCGWCGEQAFEEGFIEDSGQASRGRARWVEGPLEIGLLGGTALFGRQRRNVAAQRCTACGHLELFATEYD